MAGLEQSNRKTFPEQKFEQEVLLPNASQIEASEYSAFLNDVAVLNIYFGKANLPGESYQKQNSVSVIIRQSTRLTRG